MKWSPDAPVALVCLDLQRARLSAPDTREDADRTVAACREVLHEARARRWPILHVYRRESSAEGGRPLPGLEPRPSEAVFFRPGPSPFSHCGFRQTAHALGGPLALIGFSLADSVLATAFAAADRRLSVEVVRDAVATGVRDERGLREALTAPLTALAPIVRTIDSADLFSKDAAALVAANAP